MDCVRSIGERGEERTVRRRNQPKEHAIRSEWVASKSSAGGLEGKSAR